MLYNPEWNKKEISLKDFIQWLETKNPNETYNYQDKTGKCCLGQYMKDRNIPWTYLPKPQGGGTYREVSEAIFGNGLNQQDVLRCGMLHGLYSPRTFGKALACAKAFEKKLEKCDA